jgi:hypothetical protein
MHVDKARRDNLSACIDRFSGGRVIQVSHCRNSVACDADIGREAFASRTVGYLPVDYFQVKHSNHLFA